jgi:hypothetical protein
MGIAQGLNEQETGQKTTDGAEIVARASLATTAKTTWTCLIDAFGAGATGAGD